MHSCPRAVVVALFAASSVIGAACGPAGPTSGAAAPPAKTGEPVARIGDEVVTVDELQKKLDEQSPFIRARYAELDKRAELLDAQVRFEVLAAEGLARGYANDPEVRDALKKLIVQRLTREEFDGRVQLKDVGDGDLQRYFDEHKADYQKPEMVRASVLTIGSQVDGARARADEAQKLAATPGKLEDRAWFKDLVTKYSTDEATKPAGGDVRYVARDEVVGRFGQEAADWLFASEDLNAVSPVFVSTTPAGTLFHVFKRTGRRKAIERSFEQVKNQIKNVVYREKRTAAFNAFVDELKVKHKVQTFPDKLTQLKVPTLPKGMGAGVGDLHGDDHDHADAADDGAGSAAGVGGPGAPAAAGGPGSPLGEPSGGSGEGPTPEKRP